MSWEERFENLGKQVAAAAGAGETWTLSLEAEDSDFVRFNHGLVRQAGRVHQGLATLRWVVDGKHAERAVPVGRPDDHDTIARAISALRATVDVVAPDPHLLLDAEPARSRHVSADELPDPHHVVSQVTDGAGRQPAVDLVGFYAAGGVHRGFASSYGHHHWHTAHTYSLDWCLVQSADKAVKHALAGAVWRDEEFEAELVRGRRALEVLARPAKTVPPGGYRAFLTPSAVSELLELLAWQDFGARALADKSSALSRLAEGRAKLDGRFRLSEDLRTGLAPRFQAEGFSRPDEVVLIDGGEHVGSLVSPRSAQEYGLTPNGANGGESPEALSLAAGELQEADVIRSLDTGVYVSNLWYTNWSDQNAARVTGMTRFATFWVEGGEIVAPLAVMRFDESLYELFGPKLEQITSERHLMASTSTYGQRSRSSLMLPGLLVRDLRFTL